MRQLLQFERMRDPLRIAFLGCGFITQVHSRHLKRLQERDRLRLRQPRPREGRAYCRSYQRSASYADYTAAIERPARRRGRHRRAAAVSPRSDASGARARANMCWSRSRPFLRTADYGRCWTPETRQRVVLVGENDHYKPLAVALRTLLAEGAIGEMVFAHFTTIAKKLKTADDWRNDESMAGGDAFFEEGIHWLHLAGSLGPASGDPRLPARRSRATGRTAARRA